MAAVGGSAVLASNGAARQESQDRNQSLRSIQKMNKNMRARNPVIMSMQNRSDTQTQGPTPNSVLMPLSNRSLSPQSYQQL